MTQVWLEDVRTSRWTSKWTSRWTSSRTTGGPHGVLQGVLHRVESFQMDSGRGNMVQEWFQLKFKEST